jgi:hypothetical protein
MHAVDAYEALARIPAERRPPMPSLTLELPDGQADMWPCMMAALASLSGKLEAATTEGHVGAAVGTGLGMLLNDSITTEAWGDEARRIAREAIHRAKQTKLIASSMN